MAQAPAADKRRAILDAAITVFARQGFHSARVSDVAAEAGVAYGLVYHYFNSKDQMLNELFPERWALLVEASKEIRRGDASPRDKLAGVANFIIESYRHEPELMKVIIVEVTRAANSFGRTHLPEIRQAYDLVAEIVSDAQQTGEFRDGVDPNFAAMVFYGAIEQLLTGWIFGSIPGTDADFQRAKQLVIETICDGLEPRPVSDAVGRLAHRMWEGLARTERQDRVLHGAAKLANLLLGIILLPLWFFGQLIGGRVRDFLRGLERRGGGRCPSPPMRERTMDALMVDLHAIPEQLRLQLRRASSRLRRHLQFRCGPASRGRGDRLPLRGSSRDHIVEGADGERIAASIALQEAARPALIVVHGLFTSSRFDYVRQIGVRAFYEWGFNVAALDLRSFGMTELTSPAPSTAGWKEGLDILSLAAYMKELAPTSVGALGISLGGSSVLNACDQEATTTDLDGGILAVSPPAVPKDAWARLSEDVPRDHPRYLLHRAFEAALISKGALGSLAAGGRTWIESWSTFRRPSTASAPRRSGPTLAVSTASRTRGFRCSSCTPRTTTSSRWSRARCWPGGRGQRPGPSLDPARRIAGLLEAADPRWTHAVYRTFFERWAMRGAHRRATNPTSPETVYSTQSPGSARPSGEEGKHAEAKS